MQQRWKMNWKLKKHKNWRKAKKWSMFKSSGKIVFDENLNFWILTNIDFRERALIFQSYTSTQNIYNIVVNNMVPTWWSEIQEHTHLCYIFRVPLRNIGHNPSIDDLSCSENIFWLDCDHFRIPNGLICFHVLDHFSISHFGVFGWFLFFFIHFCSNLINFVHKILPQPPL